jgi:hypothetical protein
MNIIQCILTIVLIMVSGPVFSNTSENTASELITRTVFRDTGIHAVYLQNSLGDIQGCQLSDRFVFDVNESGGQSILAAVMTASLSGVPIQAKIQGCIDAGGVTLVTAPKAIAIIMKYTPP